MLKKFDHLCYSHPHQKMMEGFYCMSGSIFLMKDRGRWAVSWYDAAQKKPVIVTRYRGMFMPCTHYHKDGAPNRDRCQGYGLARKLLAQIQGDYENYQQGLAGFRLEKYTKKGWTDVIEYFEEWLDTIKEKKKPATYKGYRSYLKNWIEPYFRTNPTMLHEIQLPILDKLLKSIKLDPKGKYNVMNCFHAFMDYAWRAKRIPEMPPFPKKEDYGLKDPIPNVISEDRQLAIIDAMPEHHRSIFLFLKYHLRRPSEACALRKIDFDFVNLTFTIRRGISARVELDSTKTNTEHLIPCHSKFAEVATRLLNENLESPYLFCNPLGRLDGKRYTGDALNLLWNAACKKLGESIDLYSGMKHSSCSQYINDHGLSIHDLQQITDHANLESVKKYVKVKIATKRALMERSHLTVVTSHYNKTTTGAKIGE